MTNLSPNQGSLVLVGGRLNGNNSNVIFVLSHDIPFVLIGGFNWVPSVTGITFHIAK